MMAHIATVLTKMSKCPTMKTMTMMTVSVLELRQHCLEMTKFHTTSHIMSGEGVGGGGRAGVGRWGWGLGGVVGWGEAFQLLEYHILGEEGG